MKCRRSWSRTSGSPVRLRTRMNALATSLGTHGVEPSFGLAGPSNSAKAGSSETPPRASLLMEPDDPGDGGAVCLPGPVRLRRDADGAEAAVGALYQTSALSLIGLAYVMLGDRPSAEDVVQEGFCSLYRRWDRLADADSALYYVRVVLAPGHRFAAAFTDEHGVCPGQVPR